MAKKLWGGRFAKKTDPLVEDFTKSIQYDYKLAACDLVGSMAQVEVLKRAGYLKPGEAKKLKIGLKALNSSLDRGAFIPDYSTEDIHTDIQNKLEKKVGDLVLKLQTARSRNDQVVFATKLYCKISLMELEADMANLAFALDALARKYRDMVVPGYTHLQHAQPVYLKDYLGAYVEMLKRDNDRIDFINGNIKLTMGAGALAGTPIEAGLYKIKMSDLLGGVDIGDNSFDVHVTSNPLDAVSDRDFLMEILGALTITAVHLSRLSEDLIIWSTKEFGFVELDDAFCTGSSLMPQKKNADVLELVRGYAGRLSGNFVSVVTMMKGLPLTYNRDMQLDKEPLFNSVETIGSELKLLTGIVKTLKFNKEKIALHLKDESLYATDLVYYLVDLGMPFRVAHTKIGELVKYSLDSGIAIKDMAEGVLKSKLSGKVSKKEVVKRFDPEFSVKLKKSIKRKQ